MARKRKRNNNNKNSFPVNEEDEYITFDEDKRRYLIKLLYLSF